MQQNSCMLLLVVSLMKAVRMLRNSHKLLSVVEVFHLLLVLNKVVGFDTQMNLRHLLVFAVSVVLRVLRLCSSCFCERITRLIHR